MAAGGATIPTASDFFFVAVKLGRLSVVVGEVEGCTAERYGIQLYSRPQDGRPAEISRAGAH